MGTKKKHKSHSIRRIKSKLNRPLISLFLLLFFFSARAQPNTLNTSIKEVEAKLADMTVEEKIGQLFMIRAHSDRKQDHITEVKSYIKKYHVGGLCFFQGTPEKQAKLTNEYQALTKTPLLIAVDAEWGIGMRFKEEQLSFPMQMTLGAIQNEHYIYEMGKHIGTQMKNLGMHMNFAPVVDVNNNPFNPVINERSFGENPENVLSKSYHYMMGLQDAGVLACAKHFPGHGDTDKDSHYDLPVIHHQKDRLDSIEMYPFKGLINQKVDAIMSAHLNVTALDERKNRPASLSSGILTDLLKNKLKFEGLIVTDALEMEGVAKFFPNGVADVEAFLAGNDIILMPRDLDKSFNSLLKAYQTGKISPKRLDHSVRKILLAKWKIGILNGVEKINLSSVKSKIYTNTTTALKEDLIEQSITIVRDDANLIPISNVADQKIAVIHLGETSKSTFQKRVDFYANATHHNVAHGKLNTVLNKIKSRDLIIIAVSNIKKSKGLYKLKTADIATIEQISNKTKTVICHMGNPYALNQYHGSKASIFCTYSDKELYQDIGAQSLFGVSDITGELPVSSGSFKAGTSEKRVSLGRLGFGVAEGTGLSADTLQNINEIIKEMIDKKAAPGCRIFIAKDGKVVFDEAYGYHTYDKKQEVQKGDVYDLASVTKILASTVGLMQLQDQKKFSPYDPLSKYFPNQDLGNKKNMITQDILAHHSGLAGWIPFYIRTLDSTAKKPIVDPRIYKSISSDSFQLRITDKLFLRNDYRDTVWTRIIDSDLRDNRNYRYSDLGMYLFRSLIEEVSNSSFSDYLENSFYRPMGLKTMGFEPTDRIDKSRIPPTEKDDYFRNEVVQGHVHDMGAAMLDGVSGHAGLFSDAYDVAAMMQMLLNGGSYGGKEYIKPATVAKYTKRYFRSTRRGLGFDMKETDEKKRINMSEKASDLTFGHLGFTGIATFADPEHDLIYIFLSNRTYPTMKNNKFSKNEYRPRVQSVIYDALIKTKK